MEVGASLLQGKSISSLFLLSVEIVLYMKTQTVL